MSLWGKAGRRLPKPGLALASRPGSRHGLRDVAEGADMRRAGLFLVVLGLAGCEPSPGLVGAPGMRIVSTEAEVAACTPTKIYTTTPGAFGGVVGQQALEFARNQTLANAQEDGSNTMFFLEGGPDDAEALIVRARGYVC